MGAGAGALDEVHTHDDCAVTLVKDDVVTCITQGLGCNTHVHMDGVQYTVWTWVGVQYTVQTWVGVQYTVQTWVGVQYTV